jgi:hypothetical protein
LHWCISQLSSKAPPMVIFPCPHVISTVFSILKNRLWVLPLFSHEMCVSTFFFISSLVRLMKCDESHHPATIESRFGINNVYFIVSKSIHSLNIQSVHLHRIMPFCPDNLTVFQCIAKVPWAKMTPQGTSIDQRWRLIPLARPASICVGSYIDSRCDITINENWREIILYSTLDSIQTHKNMK